MTSSPDSEIIDLHNLPDDNLSLMQSVRAIKKRVEKNTSTIQSMADDNANTKFAGKMFKTVNWILPCISVAAMAALGFYVTATVTEALTPIKESIVDIRNSNKMMRAEFKNEHSQLKNMVVQNTQNIKDMISDSSERKIDNAVEKANNKHFIESLSKSMKVIEDSLGMQSRAMKALEEKFNDIRLGNGSH